MIKKGKTKGSIKRVKSQNKKTGNKATYRIKKEKK